MRTFLLRAEVMLSDGETQRLEHNLDLEYPDSSEPPGVQWPLRQRAGPPPFIFLTARVAAKLRAGLEDAGLKILDQTRLRPGDSWTDTIRRMIAQSDGVVGLVSEGEVSPWVSSEIQAATASAKPAFVLLASGASTSGLPKEVQMRQIDVSSPDLKAIAAELGSLKEH